MRATATRVGTGMAWRAGGSFLTMASWSSAHSRWNVGRPMWSPRLNSEAGYLGLMTLTSSHHPLYLGFACCFFFVPDPDDAPRFFLLPAGFTGAAGGASTTSGTGSISGASGTGSISAASGTGSIPASGSRASTTSGTASSAAGSGCGQGSSAPLMTLDRNSSSAFMRFLKLVRKGSAMPDIF